MYAHRTLTSTTRQRSPHPLGAVIAWELRHSASQRGLWMMGIAFMLLIGGLTLLSTSMGEPVTNSAVPIEIMGVGFEALKVGVILLTIDLVARDRAEGVHELLMSSALPTWAYIWGRWLAGILVCTVLSLLLLLGVILATATMAELSPGLAPPPAVAPLALAWLAFTILGVVPVGAASFAFGTALPGRIGILGAIFAGGWAFGSQFLAVLVTQESLRPWVPNHIMMALQLVHDYNLAAQEALAATDRATLSLADWWAVWHVMPDIGYWLPQLSYVGLGLWAVALTAARFQRFSVRVPSG